MKLKYVIAFVAILSLVCSWAGSVAAETSLQQKLDSLFIIASSGEVMFRDMVQPAIDSIAAMGAPVVPLLADKFITKSARERHTIRSIIMKIGGAAVPSLVSALARTDHHVVEGVCWVLGDVGDSTAIQPLTGMVGNGRWQTRDQAIGALGKIGDIRIAATIDAALTDSIGQVRKSAVVACGKLGLNQSVPAMVHLMGDEFYGARMSAMEGLLKLDTTLVVSTVIDSIDSDSRLVGNLGCRVLGLCGTDRALEVLANQARSMDPDRRAHAAVAIVAFDPADQYGFHRYLLEREEDPRVLMKIESAVYSASHAE